MREAAWILAATPAAADAVSEPSGPRVASWQRTPTGSLAPFNPQPVVFDFDLDPEPPRWLARGIVPAEGVTLLTGDAGIGKTWLALDLARAVLDGGMWLGRTVSRGSVVVVDEENSTATVHRRLRALGVGNESRDRLSYFAGNGAQIGDGGRCDVWLTEILSETQDARLVVVDTAMSATALEDVNDNTGVARMLSWLGRTVKANECAALMLHHERKAQQGQANSRKARVMGANQWRAQVEAHVAAAEAGERENEVDPDGTVRAAFHLSVSVEKLRDGVAPPTLRARVETLAHEDRLDLASVTVVDAADVPAEPMAKTKVDLMADQIVAVLATAPLTSAELAAQVDTATDDSTFKRARARLSKSNAIVKTDDGLAWTLPGAPAQDPAI